MSISDFRFLFICSPVVPIPEFAFISALQSGFNIIRRNVEKTFREDYEARILVIGKCINVQVLYILQSDQILNAIVEYQINLSLPL